MKTFQKPELTKSEMSVDCSSAVTDREYNSNHSDI